MCTAMIASQTAHLFLYSFPLQPPLTINILINLTHEKRRLQIKRERGNLSLKAMWEQEKQREA